MVPKAAFLLLVLLGWAGCAERGNPDDALCLLTVEQGATGAPFIADDEMRRAAPTLLERLPSDEERVPASCRDRARLMELAEDRTGDECSELYFRHGTPYGVQPC